MDYFPDNKLTRFTTKLPQTMELDGTWEVGLSEIHYTHSWYNVKEGEFWLRIHYPVKDQTTMKSHIYLFPEGYYKSTKALVNQMRKLKQGNDSPGHLFNLSVSELDHKAWIQVKKDSVVSVSPELQQALGFRIAMFPGGFHKSNLVADVSKGLTSMYVYCPLVEHQMVGDTHAPLLRIVPTEGRDGQNVSKVFDPIQYVPLNQRNFQTVEIDIRSDTGKPIPFEFGRVVVTLHCRKRRDSYL